MSMAKNTLNYAQLNEMATNELVNLAEEHLEVHYNSLIEEIVQSEIHEEDKEEVINYILECQNRMPN